MILSEHQTFYLKPIGGNGHITERQFSHIARMAQDVFAIPATGAGVKRQFSMSGQIATTFRCRLLPYTISAIMMYKDHLTRTGRKGLV